LIYPIIGIHGSFPNQQMSETAINLIVALPPEAKPINQYLGLVRDNRYDQYPLYRNGQVTLVISGYGVKHSAAATTWLHQINNSRPDDIWINIGIAGHPTHRVGEAFLAEKIVDQTTGEKWTLVTSENSHCPPAALFTVAEPDADYKLDGLVEMEAAGFYRSALQCTTPDRIYCLKVVSDNRDNSTERISGKMVSRLIREHLNLLDKPIKMESKRWQ
jgi:adenosylhomocysteine nucleosidase